MRGACPDEGEKEGTAHEDEVRVVVVELRHLVLARLLRIIQDRFADEVSVIRHFVGFHQIAVALNRAPRNESQKRDFGPEAIPGLPCWYRHQR
jgi:hypothetical protein